MSKVTYRLNDGIATIAMDDGKVNVMSHGMLQELNAAFDRAATDKAIVIVTGRPGVFSAGFELPVLAAGGDAAHNMVKTGFELCERVLSFPTPVVMACTGHALAMGVFLVLSGDYRIGAEGAFKLGANEVAIGITMPYFAIEMLRSRLTPTHFNRALINSEIYSSSLAVEAGFLDRVVPAAEVYDVAQHTARQLAQLDMRAHAETKLRVREQVLKAIRNSIESRDPVAAPKLQLRNA
jgi:enoyl-CoA hydratase